MSALRAELDPELLVLRSLSETLIGRPRTNWETARFNLFTALERTQLSDATRWLRALEAAALALEAPAVRTLALGALTTIAARLALTTQPDVEEAD